MSGNDVAVSSLSIIPNDCNRGLGDYAGNVCVSITWTWIIGGFGEQGLGAIKCNGVFNYRFIKQQEIFH